MKVYKYCVYRNNCVWGVQFFAAFDSLGRALMCKEHLQSTGKGCCDVVKKRIDPTTGKPLRDYISNNYKYSEYDLE